MKRFRKLTVHVLDEDERRMTPLKAWLKFAGLCAVAVILGMMVGYVLLSPFFG